ncbi:unnamed protein product [Ectocarpus sp. 6 AP-2014]
MDGGHDAPAMGSLFDSNQTTTAKQTAEKYSWVPKVDRRASGAVSRPNQVIVMHLYTSKVLPSLSSLETGKCDKTNNVSSKKRTFCTSAPRHRTRTHEATCNPPKQIRRVVNEKWMKASFLSVGMLRRMICLRRNPYPMTLAEYLTVLRAW